MNMNRLGSLLVKLLPIGLLIMLFPASLFSVSFNKYVVDKPTDGAFPLIVNGQVVPIVASQSDEAGVKRVVALFQADLEKVAGVAPQLLWDQQPSSTTMLLVGTLGKNPMIDQLVKEGKLNASELMGKWEKFHIQTIANPFPGVDQALVIVGSDKRGTIYGMFDLSAQMGVSPWYFWADVPVEKKNALYVLAGNHTQGEPVVKYRGIFINDEAPALAGWAEKYHGGFTHTFYDKVFELILRLKGNYLWPAMWGRAFYDDDVMNAPLANEYGIVIGTSHHEPLMRAHDEWRRYGSGKWNFTTNADTLSKFWADGISRMGNNESLVTIGMRGDGDEPMAEGTAIEVLENIVTSQRGIIEQVTGKKAAEVPQVWALYKEVQDYYDHGMRVPDDVTLLLCDDNWGNIRKLPQPNETQHSGGYGIYYHYDYVGGPRNYKWINTNHISRVWEQMHMAWEHGADRLWIVNVGDIKPMEFPIEFFLDYAWNPSAIAAEMLPDYTLAWAQQQFGGNYATEIAKIVNDYSFYNARRKPELLDWNTYSLTNFREFERVVEDYNNLAQLAQDVYSKMPTQYQDAYYQLVLYPAVACATVNELYLRVAQNHLFAQQGRTAANDMAKKAFALFNKDAELTKYYNDVMANGKWSHMMDQTRIGYTYWQQPETNVMPEVKTIQLPDSALIGVAVDGSASWWPNQTTALALPQFYSYQPQKYYIDIFSRGTRDVLYSVKSDAAWVKISEAKGHVTDVKRVWIEIDWKKVPKGSGKARLTIDGPVGQQAQVEVIANTVKPSLLNDFNGFVEVNGYVSIEAQHYTHAIEAGGVKWQVIPGLGKTLSGITPMPSTSVPQQAAYSNNAMLTYDVYLQSTGDIDVQSGFSPTLDYLFKGGLKYAVSIDGGQPVVANVHPLASMREWEKAVADNLVISSTKHKIDKPGKHTVTIHMMDPGLVLQKIVLNCGSLPNSYLGPDETRFVK